MHCILRQVAMAARTRFVHHARHAAECGGGRRNANVTGYWLMVACARMSSHVLSLAPVSHTVCHTVCAAFRPATAHWLGALPCRMLHARCRYNEAIKASGHPEWVLPCFNRPHTLGLLIANTCDMWCVASCGVACFGAESGPLV